MTTFDNKILTSQNPVWLKHHDFNVFGGPLKPYKKSLDETTNQQLKIFRKSIDLSKISKKLKSDKKLESEETRFDLPRSNRILLRFFDINNHTKSKSLPDNLIQIDGYTIEPERQDTPALLPGEIDLTDAFYEFRDNFPKENPENPPDSDSKPDKFKLEVFWSSETKDIEYGWCLFIAEKIPFDKLPICYNELEFDNTYFPERCRNLRKRDNSSRERSKSRSSNESERNSRDRKKQRYSHEDEGYFDNRMDRPRIRDERRDTREMDRPTIRDYRDHRDTTRESNRDFHRDLNPGFQKHLSTESNYSANYMIDGLSDPDLGRVEEEKIKRFIERANHQKISEFIEALIESNRTLEHCVHYRKTYIVQKLFETKNVERRQKERLAKHILNFRNDAVFYLARHNVGNFALRELIQCVGQDDILNEIFEALKPDLVELSCNKFGCFIIQNLVNSLCDKDFMEMKNIFVNHRKLIHSICNSYGSRTMQKLVARLDYKELVGFVKKLREHLVEIACDQHGTYLVQKLLDLLDNDDIIHYFTNIIDNSMDGLRDCIDSFAGRTLLRKLLPRLPNSYINKYKDKLSHSYYQQVTILLKHTGN